MQLVDAHCHLESEAFAADREAVVQGAKSAGVVKLMTAAVEPSEWPLSKQVAEQFDEVEFALGLHPWYATKENLDALSSLKEAGDMGAKAIGEIGLDKRVESPAWDLQFEAFRRQLTIAIDLDLPVVVHCRGAFNELIETVKESGLPNAGGVVHAFSGGVEIAEACMKHGFVFSMGRFLTYRNSPKRAAVLRRIYPNHLLLETDSPDMPPVALKDRRNVSANLVHMLRAAAAILDVSEEEVAEHTTENAARIFGLAL